MSKNLFRPDLDLQVPSSIQVPRTKVMMSLNEGPRDPLTALWPSISKRLLDVGVNRYRTRVTSQLVEELGRYVGVGQENLLMGNGADEILYYLFTAVRQRPGDFLVTLAPTYPDYKRYARAVGLDIREISLDEDFLFDPPSVLNRASDPGCRAILICNPNNPTGNLFPAEVLRELIRESSCLVVIDEAYYEFSGVTFLSEAVRNRRVVLVRSFSKGFSAAGLRFGYLIAHPDTVAAVDKVRTFFNLGLVAQVIALELLLHRDELGRWNEDLKRERDWLYQEMEGLPLMTPFASETNFILFRIQGDHRAVQRHLASRGVSVRDVSLHPLLHHCLRVTLGLHEENAAFLAALGEGLDEAKEREK